MKCFQQMSTYYFSKFSKCFNTSSSTFLSFQKRFFQTSINNKEQLRNCENKNLDTDDSLNSVLEFYSNLFSLTKAEVPSFLPLDLLWQALTHKSYQHGKFPYNEKLSFQGRQVLKFHLALYTVSSFSIYKNNILTLKKIHDFTSPQTMGVLALQYGIDKSNHKKSGLLKIASESLCAIIGAMFLHKGGAVTKEFIEKKIFSQKTLNDM
ncbi:hypothetical protein PMAC_000764 [Pneumocystis sp. 'macacae']|nr:hypothetical protein PMAC_000764 [Pneumocystis sp. 'macacae']